MMMVSEQRRRDMTDIRYQDPAASRVGGESLWAGADGDAVGLQCRVDRRT